MLASCCCGRTLSDRIKVSNAFKWCIDWLSGLESFLIGFIVKIIIQRLLVCLASLLISPPARCASVLLFHPGNGETFWSGLRSVFTVSSILALLPCPVSGSHWHLLAMAAVVSYSPPWWVNLLHRLPHFNLQFEQTSSDFQPEDWTYQQVTHTPLTSFCIVSHYQRSRVNVIVFGASQTVQPYI